MQSISFFSCRRSVATLVIAVIIVLLIPNFASGQDIGISDSAYFLQPEFKLVDCSGTVEFRLKVRLFVDVWATASSYHCKLQASPNAVFDTGFVYTMPNVECDDIYTAGFRYPETNQFSVGAACQNLGSVIPFDGVAFEYVLLAQSGDTITVQLATISDILIGFPIQWWPPLYIDLYRTIAVPSDFTIDPGDCDCSGIISVSDVVYLIQFIFAGGPPPNPLSAADANADCTVSVSDAVYLINYIFGGGDPPQPGCAK